MSSPTIEAVAAASRASDRSGTLAAGNTAQLLMAANSARRGFLIQNISAGDLWVNELGSPAALTQPSIKIAAGTTLASTPSWNPVGAMSIIGATLGQAFTAREF